MTKEKITGLICCCLFLGWIAFACLVGTCDILSLKISSEEVNGSIDEIQRNQVAGRGFSYRLICSFTIDGKSYNRWIPVTDIFPFVELIYNEYQRGDTVFLVNQDVSNVFPKYRINLELRRRLYRLVIFIALLVFSIKVYITPPKETPSINIKNRKCRMCNTVYRGYETRCPKCRSYLYGETDESLFPDKRCLMCKTVFKGTEYICPECGSNLYEPVSKGQSTEEMSNEQRKSVLS